MKENLLNTANVTGNQVIAGVNFLVISKTWMIAGRVACVANFVENNLQS